GGLVMSRTLMFLIQALIVAFPLTTFAGTIKNIPLSVGIIHDETLQDMPNNFDLTGTYKPYVRLEYNNLTHDLRFVPRREGFGTLEILDKHTRKPVYRFTVDVRKTDLNRVAREISSLLSEIEGINIKIANNKVVVDGQILLPNDMKRIHDVVKQYGDLATSLVTLSPEAQVK